jgi:hypothetical protein
LGFKTILVLSYRPEMVGGSIDELDHDELPRHFTAGSTPTRSRDEGRPRRDRTKTALAV